ncbi:unnamed protein product [Bursaphelenchus okinawaensis]|uniref:Uncharacterized protein n=1 Tax=Bursaphelenchus okinawaensis TaxID=465554 RepID=A0A811LLL6_9BILA|nr:unnamed protein product [Bursaphelenchus okinawaensis]CAG9123685.1 unnamed protein product [Bursaphelenchus okinawaensis]
MRQRVTSLLNIDDWEKTVNIIAIGHIVLHMIFLAFEIYSEHWYGVFGSCLGIVSCVALAYGNKKRSPLLFLPYLLFSTVLIAAWLGAAVYLIAEAVDSDEDVHTLLRYQSPTVAIVMGSIEIVISLVQAVALAFVFRAGNLLRKNGFY